MACNVKTIKVFRSQAYLSYMIYIIRFSYILDMKNIVSQNPDIVFLIFFCCTSFYIQFRSPIKRHPVVVFFLVVRAITSLPKRKFSCNSHQLYILIEDGEKEEEDIYFVAPRLNKTLQNLYKSTKRTA